MLDGAPVGPGGPATFEGVPSVPLGPGGPGGPAVLDGAPVGPGGPAVLDGAPVGPGGPGGPAVFEGVPSVPLGPGGPAVLDGAPSVPLGPGGPGGPVKDKLVLVTKLPDSSVNNILVSVVPSGTAVNCAEEPVIEVVAVKEFKLASDPLVISFFQFGIFTYIMVGYTKCPLPFRANNIS